MGAQSRLLVLLVPAASVVFLLWPPGWGCFAVLLLFLLWPPGWGLSFEASVCTGSNLLVGYEAMSRSRPLITTIIELFCQLWNIMDKVAFGGRVGLKVCSLQ